MKKTISRKKFLSTAIASLAGIKLMSQMPGRFDQVNEHMSMLKDSDY